jgi:Ni,Fe-hydrogenase III large subunit
MTRSDYLERLTARLSNSLDIDQQALAPAWLLDVDLADWRQAAALANAMQARFSAFWVEQVNDEFVAYCNLVLAHEYLVIGTRCAINAALPSIADIYPAADRPERHARDLFGIDISNAPDPRRWIRHQAWRSDEFPLGDGDTAIPSTPTPPDDGYPFVSAQGASVVEIPVGPIHAGIIEPGHFRFQAMGETVLNLEQHLGYTHKGIEALARGKDADGLVRLAGRVSGDSTVAHSWAACQALESARQIEVPERALWLRGLMAERERVANHLGDIGGICNDVGFTFAQAQLTRLRELWLRENQQLFGHRLLMDRVVPGGVSVDIGADTLPAMIENAQRLSLEFAGLIECFEASESLEDRLMTTGRLTREQAQMLGVTGYVGKASGQDFDLRRDSPYAPYDQLDIEVPVFHAGDVAARAKVRADEVVISLRLIEQIAARMPAGQIRSNASFAGAAARGLGIVEGWRGEIVTFVRLDSAGKVSRFFPRDPSW